MSIPLAQHRTKRIGRAVAVASIALLALSGCTANTTSNPAGGDAQGDASSTRTIIDHTGEEIEIPAEIDRVAVDQIPIASTYTAFFEGEAPYLVGMSQAVVDSLEGTVAADIAPELLEVETGYYDNGELNVESLLELDPDVVLYNASNAEHGELFEKAGIPAVGFKTQGDPAVTYTEWLRLLEDVFDEDGKMDEVIEYGAGIIADAREKNAQIPEADRKDVLEITGYKPGTLTVQGEPEFFGTFWLDTANADNAAIGAQQPLSEVSSEQLLQWDPDVILLSGYGHSGLLPEDVLGGLEGVDLSTMTAVQEGEVLSTRLGWWNWFTPNPDAPLVAHWIGAAVYPELADPEALDQLTREYYLEVYGYELSDEQLEHMYADSYSAEVDR